jgi:outer membrane protein OmpA-like peptidoglycan-associated protein
MPSGALDQEAGPASLDVRRRGLLRALGLAPLALAGCQLTAPPTGAGRASPGWTPAQRAALKEMGFAPDGDEWDLSLAASLLFEFDSDRLQREQLLRLMGMGRRLRELGVPRIRVEGHTDAVGEPSYNRELSVRRADAVAQVLRAAGWDGLQLGVRGYGRDKPIADNGTEDGRAQNRRVVLIASAA